MLLYGCSGCIKHLEVSSYKDSKLELLSPYDGGHRSITFEKITLIDNLNISKFLSDHFLRFFVKRTLSGFCVFFF